MDLVDFVSKARTKTWAGGMDKGRSNRTGSRGSLVYQEGNLRYEDEYFGEDRFQGQEIVYQDDKPVWGMVYYGGMVAENGIDSQDEFGFLKRALLVKAQKARLTGIAVYSEGDRSYRCETKGDWSDFRGEEKIRSRDVIVHRVVFAGGIIKEI